MPAGCCCNIMPPSSLRHVTYSPPTDSKRYSTTVFTQIMLDLPYRMKIYTEFNLATWLRMVKFMELNNIKS